MSRETDSESKHGKRGALIGWSLFALIVVVLFVVLAKVASNPEDNKPNKSISAADANIRTSEAPWTADQEHLSARLQYIGLPQLSSEGTVLHIHQHLDISVHGQTVPVPAEIGIGPNGAFISELHTHDKSGIIHVEAPEVKDFTLGQFMDVWGVKFDQTHLGAYTADSTNKLAVYANGKLVNGDPRKLKLTEHEEIVIVYGTDSEKPQVIPATFSFPQGL
jgi:hypothetical protein